MRLALWYPTEAPVRRAEPRAELGVIGQRSTLAAELETVLSAAEMIVLEEPADRRYTELPAHLEKLAVARGPATRPIGGTDDQVI
jgi:hypothetical protein